MSLSLGPGTQTLCEPHYLYGFYGPAWFPILRDRSKEEREEEQRRRRTREQWCGPLVVRGQCGRGKKGQGAINGFTTATGEVKGGTGSVVGFLELRL